VHYDRTNAAGGSLIGFWCLARGFHRA
jgi:hypothetical protein